MSTVKGISSSIGYLATTSTIVKNLQSFAKNDSILNSTIIEEELLLDLEENVEGFNKERLIWILNLIVTIIIFGFNVVFLLVYYMFPRIRNKNINCLGNSQSNPDINNDAEGKRNIRTADDTDVFFNTHFKNANLKKNSVNLRGNTVLAPHWGCPNQCCLHLTWGSLLFLLVKVTVDIFFLKVRYLTSSIMIFSIFLLRLLDATLVFNSVYLMFLWFKTVLNSVDINDRSIRLSFQSILCYRFRSRPTRAVNESELGRRVTLIPEWVTKFFIRSTNRSTCILSAVYGAVLAVVITLVFNIRGDHVYFHEYQAVKYSLLIQTFHVTLNLILWGTTLYRYNKLSAYFKTKVNLSKNVKTIKDISESSPTSNNDDSLTLPYIVKAGGVNATDTYIDNSNPINLPYENLSYYFWISFGNFMVYTPFLWFYLIALLFRPKFLYEMLNMQGLIGFLGTLFDIGACIPVFVASFHDKSLRLSFIDFIYCRFVGGRKSGNMELIN
ncbi:unnamed protein product [Gordionus sp. m RMFG-2023]|uniref:uncharacterized protein LOC135928987 n=1 Tax=Gordionus sp. m RMFG-2023 TaxID=3053472 RepID=UPI0030E03158